MNPRSLTSTDSFRRAFTVIDPSIFEPPLRSNHLIRLPGFRQTLPPPSRQGIVEQEPEPVAGVEIRDTMDAKSFLAQLQSPKSGWVDPDRNYVVTGRERHVPKRRSCYA